MFYGKIMLQYWAKLQNTPPLGRGILQSLPILYYEDKNSRSKISEICMTCGGLKKEECLKVANFEFHGHLSPLTLK